MKQFFCTLTFISVSFFATAQDNSFLALSKKNLSKSSKSLLKQTKPLFNTIGLGKLTMTSKDKLLALPKQRSKHNMFLVQPKITFYNMPNGFATTSQIPTTYNYDGIGKMPNASDLVVSSK